MSRSPRASLPSFAAIWSDAADAVWMPRTSENELEWHLQLFTIIHSVNNVQGSKYKTLILSVNRLGFALKKRGRFEEGRFAFYLSMYFDCRNMNWCINTSAYCPTPSHHRGFIPFNEFVVSWQYGVNIPIQPGTFTLLIGGRDHPKGNQSTGYPEGQQRLDMGTLVSDCVIKAQNQVLQHSSLL